MYLWRNRAHPEYTENTMGTFDDLSPIIQEWVIQFVLAPLGSELESIRWRLGFGSIPAGAKA
jgi:hypothetical protein